MIRIPFDPNISLLGPLTLSWHGFFTFVGVAVAVYLVARYSYRVNVKDETIYEIATWAILGGVIGARVFHVIDNWEFYSPNPITALAIWNGGIALYGAILGGTAAGILYARYRGFPVGKICDITAPALLVGQAIGRIGDIVNGEHFSKATDLPWAWVHTNPNSPAFGRPPSHPAVAYEMIWDLTVAAVLWRLIGRAKPDGMVFLLYLTLYSAGRFFISFIREDRIIFAGLQQAQIIALLTVILVVPIIIYKIQWGKTPSLAPTQEVGEEAQG